MSYTVLARRYRSNTFDDLIGQEHVARTLKRAIESGRIAHAYLFCGTRGTGKTSSARILAKCLNCESFPGPTVAPCLTCSSCLGVARGDDIDVIEIDAASNTGVDNVRDIIENSQYRPARARFKIYIVDEVHMLSKNAFNALLKILEEPPGHVKFILATTEPEKVLATILSRCQRYDFRNIPTREIAGHLKAICAKENVAADDDALLLVAKAGAGSMRDSLSLLDRLLSLGETRVTTDMIEQLLGLPKSQLLFDLADAIGTGDTRAALERADAMVVNGLSPDSLIASLVEHLRNLLILNTCGPDSDLVEVPGLPLKDLVAQSTQFDAISLSQDVAILEELRRTMRTSQAGRALLDATLVRLTLSAQFTRIDDLLEGEPMPAQKKNGDGVRGPRAASMPDARERVVGAFLAPAPNAGAVAGTAKPRAASEVARPADAVSVAAPMASVAPEPVALAPEPSINLADIDLGDDDDLPRPGKVWDGAAPSLATIMSNRPVLAAPTVVPPPAAPSSVAPAPASREPDNVEAVPVDSLPDTWRALLALLAQHSHGLHGILSLGRFAGINDGRAVVKFASEQASLVKMLDRNGKKEAVAKAFTQVRRQETGVRFEVDDAPPAPPALAPPPAALAAAPSPAARPATIPPTGPASHTHIGVTPPVRAPHASPPRPAAAPAQAEPAGIRVTPEMEDAFYRDDPLVRAVVDELGGKIVKVEESR